VLGADEIERFVEVGWLRLGGAIEPDVADRCREEAASQLAIPDGPPWPDPVVRGLVTGPGIAAAARSTALDQAVGQLLEGEAWQRRPNLGLLVVRCPTESDPGDTGWHIDASFEGSGTTDFSTWYVNRRSRGRGLLLLCLLSDVGPDDAPTRILDGSHRAVARSLQPFGDEGTIGLAAPLPEPTGPISLVTGRAGDVFACHPFLVHAASWPHRGDAPRYLAQPPIGLDGELRTDRPLEALSPVARAIA